MCACSSQVGRAYPRAALPSDYTMYGSRGLSPHPIIRSPVHGPQRASKLTWPLSLNPVKVGTALRRRPRPRCRSATESTVRPLRCADGGGAPSLPEFLRFRLAHYDGAVEADLEIGRLGIGEGRGGAGEG